MGSLINSLREKFGARLTLDVNQPAEGCSRRGLSLKWLGFQPRHCSIQSMYGMAEGRAPSRQFATRNFSAARRAEVVSKPNITAVAATQNGGNIPIFPQVVIKFRVPALLILAALCSLPLSSGAQAHANQRTFPQSKAAIEKVVKALQSAVSGRLPLLEGFTIADERPLTRFQRGYYQCVVEIVPLPTGGSRVRVAAKITAWYADPVATHSGYQTLLSNGRIEADLLEQIADGLRQPADSASAVKNDSASTISAPVPRLPENAVHGSPINSPDGTASLKSQTESEEKRETQLTAEAKGLEEILQNQSHPSNLISVKKSGTPILQSPAADAKVLFNAAAEDEFEILDLNANWVHVRISGLSRGWIRRSAVEMPQEGTPSPQKTELFRLSNEQVATFPGDWEPLRGKIVKILTIQKSKEDSTNEAKLEFAKRILLAQFAKLADASDAPAGIVLIFDSEDGGMIAAATSTLKEWQAGSASDEAVWQKCFFDPPELAGKK